VTTTSIQPPACAWAVQTALRLRGADDVAWPMLFGLGGGAWCGVRMLADGSACLRGLHEDRIKLAFYALNVWSVRFRYLSRDAVAQLRERCSQDLQTLVVVDPEVLAGERAGACESREQVMLVTGVREDAGVEYARVQHVMAQDGVDIPMDVLQRAWFRVGEDGAAATFYWHPMVDLRWQPTEAIPRALRRHVHRMRVTNQGSETCGLAAILALASGEIAPERLQHSALRLRGTGVGGLHREHMAAFLRTAACAIDSPALLECASTYEQSALLWRRVLDAWAGARAANGSLLAEIGRLERLALDALDPVCHAQPGAMAHA
jgi:hypothetical protein